MFARLRDQAKLTRPEISQLNRLLQCVLLGISACLISSAHAVKLGHSRLVSQPGQPLEIILPVTQLTAEDLKVIKVQVASSTLWSQAGLTPPVPLDDLRVSVRPGSGADGRILLVQSSRPSNQSVVDVLLTLSTASGSSQLQVSLLQPEFAPVDLAFSQQSIKVQPGETLYGIAQRNMVAGATIHQVLWALFEANPGAFISDNMNLLRAGAVLRIPAAQTVLSTDASTARARFLEHDARFKSLRGKRAAVPGQPPVVGSASTSKGKVTSSSPQSPEGQDTRDRLRLSTSPQDRQADQLASSKKEITENQARIGELQQNIQQMQQALGQSAGSGPTTGSVSSGTTGGPQASTGAQTAGASPALTSPHSTSTTTSDSGVSSAAASAASAVSSGSTASSGAVASGVSTANANSMGGQSVASGASGKPTAAGQRSDTDRQSASGQAQKEVHVATRWLKDHLLVVLTAFFAILAFLIGMRMRRVSARRDDESEDPDAAQLSPAAKTAFEKKLQSIDLNLDTTESPSGVPKKTTH